MERIRAYIEGLDEITILSGQGTHDAVIRNVEIIGEACNNPRPANADFSFS